jgi:hypothetical protein
MYGKLKKNIFDIYSKNNFTYEFFDLYFKWPSDFPSVILQLFGQYDGDVVWWKETPENALNILLGRCIYASLIVIVIKLLNQVVQW